MDIIPQESSKVEIRGLKVQLNATEVERKWGTKLIAPS